MTHRDATQPTPAQIRAARESVGLSQTAAAALIACTLRGGQGWGAGNRRMQPALWRAWRHLAGIERMPFRAAAVRVVISPPP